ncbi:MAG TPA: hypothetical protein VFX13_05520 [Gaiellales bacterium]|jgi:hypothetical protein|nr:hypothetical protein [Gaiellales bacterium]
MSGLDEAPAAIAVRDLPVLAAGLVTVTAWGLGLRRIRAAGAAPVVAILPGWIVAR